MDKMKHLKHLTNLLNEGKITQDEFNAEINNILNAESGSAKQVGINKKTIIKWIGYSIVSGMVLLSIFLIVHDIYNSDKAKNTPLNPTPFVSVYFQEEEVFPVYLMYLHNTKQGFLDFTITNPTAKRITVEVTFGFSEFGGLESRTITIEASSVEKVSLTPYSEQLMQQYSGMNGTIILKVTDEKNGNIFTKLWNIRVNPADEIPWIVKNRDCTDLIASWVTPQNNTIKKLMDQVKVKSGGYFKPAENLNDEDFDSLVKNIFNTLRSREITYIKSTISFGADFSQRVRLPYQSINTKSANSIDGSVLLASMFENAGLRPFVVILLDHVIVGVARPNQPNDIIYIETTLMGRSTLENIFSLSSAYSAATKMGKESYNKAYDRFVKKESGRFNVIDIHKARTEGILPIN